jgi:iron complex transport system ATP-binding protein
MLNIQNISGGYHGEIIINNLNFTASRGQLSALVGPNGAGKSTLLKMIAGVVKPVNGKMIWDNMDLFTLSPAERAKYIAFIPQNFDIQFDYSVYDIILMGRFPFLNIWGHYSSKDKEVVEELMEKFELTELRDHPVNQISGGEKQRVSIARALAQESEILLMDEGFSFLDLNHQIEIMKILKNLTHNDNKLVILVSHNLNLVSSYADEITMLKKGEVVAKGKPAEVFDVKKIRNLYNAEMRIELNPKTQRPIIIYPEIKC